MANEIQIIKLPPEEWQFYRNIRLTALKNDPQAFGSSYEKEISYPDEKWQERTKSAYEGNSNWMVFAKDGESLVGMMGAYQTAQDKVNNIANIVSVYVASEARGKGVSKKLMQKLLDELRASKVAKVKLSVNELQTPAVKLYESFGFKKVGSKNEKLGDGKYYDELLMETNL